MLEFHEKKHFLLNKGLKTRSELKWMLNRQRNSETVLFGGGETKISMLIVMAYLICKKKNRKRFPL